MSNDSIVLLDAAGRRHEQPGRVTSPVAYRVTKGMQYPADPPRPEEIILVIRQAGQDRHGLPIPDAVVSRRPLVRRRTRSLPWAGDG